MIRRGLASGGLLVAVLGPSPVLSEALGGSALATLLAWAVLFGGLGAAVALAVRGDGLAWAAAGLLALLLLDASLVAQLAGLPGQSQRSWDTPAVAALAGEVLVLLLWLAARSGPRTLLLRVTAIGAAGLVAVALLPLGSGVPETRATPAALTTHLGHIHPGSTVAAPTPTAPP